MAKKTKTQKALEKAQKELNAIGDFSYKDSMGLKSAFNTANSAYDNWLSNPEANGYNPYISDVNDLFNQIMNMEKFSYNPNSDPLFQLYKQQYQQQGTRAMQNQMGVAAAATGGYNSSAMQTAAQSTWQNYMDALANKQNETYQNALNRYNQNAQQLVNRYNTAKDMNNSANNAYWQQANILGNQANSAYNAFRDDMNTQYNQYSDRLGVAQKNVDNWQNAVNAQQMRILQKKLYTGK